jgi:hypothetical protein
MHFISDDIFNPSHKMGEAKMSLATTLERFPDYKSGCDKCAFSWSGIFVTSSGERVRASFWDWKGSLRYAGYVSIWVSDYNYLNEFQSFLEQ